MSTARALLLKAESPRPAMAKADLRKAEIPFKLRVGQAIARARALRGWSLKELAGALDRDPRQIARWENGMEPPQFHALFALSDFQQPMVIAFAELVQSVEIDTVIRLPRQRMKESA
jgi:transcriptional regulator with XRE-family HTH domain